MYDQVYAVRNFEELKAVSEQNGNIRVISQLSGKELRSPASRWTIRHLIAYRLLIRPEAAFPAAL